MTAKTITTPSEFHQQIMEPDYKAFVKNPTDLRLAFHAAMALFHMRDWVARACGQRPADLQKDLEQRCKYFGLIRDVANASKHLQLTRRSTSMTGAADVQLREIGPGGFGVGAIAYDQAGAWGPVLAIVADPDGDFFEAASAAVYEMWGQLFAERGWS